MAEAEPLVALKALLTRAAVPAAIIEFITKEEGEGLACTSVQDFAGVWATARYEEEASNCASQALGRQAKQVEIGRLRNCWLIAVKERDRSIAEAAGGAGPSNSVGTNVERGKARRGGATRASPASRAWPGSWGGRQDGRISEWLRKKQGAASGGSPEREMIDRGVPPDENKKEHK